VIPGGVLRRTALGRHGRIPAVVFDPHHRVLAQRAALGAAAGDDDHRHAAQRGPLGAAGALVELDLVADPLRGAGLVVPGKWHATRLYPSGRAWALVQDLSLIHISEPTRLRRISYAVFCLKKKKKKEKNKKKNN